MNPFQYVSIYDTVSSLNPQRNDWTRTLAPIIKFQFDLIGSFVSKSINSFSMFGGSEVRELKDLISRLITPIYEKYKDFGPPDWQAIIDKLEQPRNGKSHIELCAASVPIILMNPLLASVPVVGKDAEFLKKLLPIFKFIESSLILENDKAS
jgi:hypothetical protein